MKLKFFLLFGIFLFLFYGCGETILSLNQPGTATTGEIIQVNIIVNATTSGGQASTGIGIIKLPENWKIINVSYIGYVNDSLYEASSSYNQDYLENYNKTQGYKLYYLKGNYFLNSIPGSIFNVSIYINVTTNGTYYLDYGVGNLYFGVYNWSYDNQINVSGPNLNTSSTIIDSCKSIQNSGKYTLSNNLNSYNLATSCIDIRRNDVEIDCQNYIISGLNYSSGIQIRDARNISIKNCQINKFYNGLNFYKTNYSSVINSSFSNAVLAGLYAKRSLNISFKSIQANNGSYYGALLYNNSNLFINESSFDYNDYGISVYRTGNSSFYNFNARHNSDRGLYILTSRSSNNYFEGGDIRFNTLANIWFHSGFGAPANNIIKKFYLNNKSHIFGSYNFSNYSNVLDGNYWDDFNSSIHPPYCFTINTSVYSFCDLNGSGIPIQSIEMTIGNILPANSFMGIIIGMILIIFWFI
ncbi:MAG: right-handed parallel beta-helix repeat-containing protein [Nanoarchaeota archaeon]|nr:right-handed parallel beta-helix repeat-containing protein [Nanoarchaeota archaeon]